jgi:hypothetical protein
MKLFRFLTWFLLLSCATVTAQSSRNFGFVSPNTRDNLRLTDAMQGMFSQEELDLLSHAKNLGCVIKQTITTEAAVGSWSDGAEHSILIRANANESTIRYLMSRLGRDANQKAVLYFHPKPRGRAKIYIIRHIRDRNFRQIGNVLEESGISFRTLVPARHGTIVYIIDIENKLGRNVFEAARRLRQRITSQSGSAAFIGDDSSRDKGQAVFAEEIKQYELKHPKLPPPCEVKQ